ncbi:MAG: hypothetical protein JSS66_16415 [Armatimonadetes bacterium]|nr:hypothetical protein [Armatimonadota bacterium]
MSRALAVLFAYLGAVRLVSVVMLPIGTPNPMEDPMRSLIMTHGSVALISFIIALLCWFRASRFAPLEEPSGDATAANWGTILVRAVGVGAIIWGTAALVTSLVVLIAKQGSSTPLQLSWTDLVEGVTKSLLGLIVTLDAARISRWKAT